MRGEEVIQDKSLASLAQTESLSGRDARLTGAILIKEKISSLPVNSLLFPV